MRKFPSFFSIAAIFLVWLAAMSCTSLATKEVKERKPDIATFTNPILSSGADPWCIYQDGYYYYTHTLQDSIGLWRTKDITDLKNAEYKTIWIPPVGMAYSKHIWSPKIRQMDGSWYVHYAADDGDTDNHRLYVLQNSAKDPFNGEFTMKGKIQTDKDDQWAIDGSVFTHKGVSYMVWSGWPSRRTDTETQYIYIARMKNPWTLDSERIILSKPEYEWELIWQNPDEWSNTPVHPIYVNEGPEVLQKGNKLFLIYSASGCWTPYYALGMLTADADSDLLDPASWEKSPVPVFQQSPENGVFGTGHPAFFKSPDGTEDWILYHANDLPEQGCGEARSPRAQKIDWKSDGSPDFGIPIAPAYPLPKPSGTVASALR